MEENTTIDVNYIKGFNEGYILSKRLPDLAQQLSEIKSESPRMEGFQDGRNEFMQEKSKEKLPWLNRDFTNINTEKNKGDKEPDKE